MEWIISKGKKDYLWIEETLYAKYNKEGKIYYDKFRKPYP